jgi:hypothetical protein
VCWKPCSSCWSSHLLREEFLSAPIHSALSGSPYRSFTLLLRSRCQRCGARRAERGVARISAKGCSVGRGVGEVRGAKVGGEKVAAATTRGESGRRLLEGGVLPH